MSRVDRLRADLADRYVIEREVGSGAMSIVFLAEDLKHHRQVAIKVFRPEVAGATGAVRFLGEIEIAAGLSHPHILPLFDSGESAGLLYYVMPFVEGESLRDRLAREGELSPASATEVMIEVADALAHAHAQGVTHRDIKPDNVMLTEHHALVTDFGVAQAIGDQDDDRESPTRGTMAWGTPAYMAPEQVTSDGEPDHRADIYSLGALAFEMLTGGPPLPPVLLGSDAPAAEPVSALREDVSPALSDVIAKCLERDPDDRWQTAEEMLPDLKKQRAPSGGVSQMLRRAVRNRPALSATVAVAGVALLATAATGIWTLMDGTAGATDLLTQGADEDMPRIVVLPFQNLGSEEDQYFADGITEEINNRLARISGLRVTSRLSALRYRGSALSLREIAEELGVDYVLEGSIRTDRSSTNQGQVRISPQLISVADDAQLWTDAFTADLVPGALFALQATVAENVAQALDVTLFASERRSIEFEPTADFEAYQYYLRGQDHFSRSGNRRDIEAAIEFFQAAVDIDPGFALAHAALARAEIWLAWQWDQTGGFVRAKQAAETALALEPELPEGRLALAEYYYRAERDFDRALAMLTSVRQDQPNNAVAVSLSGAVHRRRGEWEQAAADSEAASRLNPLRYLSALTLGQIYAYTRDYARAELYFERAISLRPESSAPYIDKAVQYLSADGSTARVVRTLREAKAAAGPGVLVSVTSGRVPSLMTLIRVAPGEFREALEDAANDPAAVERPIYYLARGEYHAQTGSQETALAYFDSARVVLEPLHEAAAATGTEEWAANLAIAYSGLGRGADAVRKARQAVSLLPTEADAHNGPHQLWVLAWVAAEAGEIDVALSALEELLSAPSLYSEATLRVDPVWHPLREDPRFQELLGGDR